MEDIRHFVFSSLDKVELTQDQEDAMDNIITSMDLMEAYEYVCCVMLVYWGKIRGYRNEHV